MSIVNICAGSTTCAVNPALADSTANNAPIANDASICFHTLGSQYMNTASWTAGQPLKLTFTHGQYGASHGGGHCQFSLSYDGGKTFVVIYQVLENCFFPNVYQYSFDLPSGLPSSDNVIFSWSWVNAIGNREFYVNCLKVSIKGTASSYSGKQMVIANHNGGPTIAAFGSDYTTGLKYYTDAATITVTGSGTTTNQQSSAGDPQSPGSASIVGSPMDPDGDSSSASSESSARIPIVHNAQYTDSNSLDGDESDDDCDDSDDDDSDVGSDSGGDSEGDSDSNPGGDSGNDNEGGSSGSSYTLIDGS
ncbi:hypothetical protein BX070DRAFT_210593 [Coemansia spiralis]|nr:hypothetical protein BX070DRAFT_210593 [Coemansia spiralis]